MKILYCGDDEIASLYLLGALSYLGHKTVHVFPTESFPGLMDKDVLILSDYPAAKISPEQSEDIASFVTAGGKLLMLGGWESFNGFGRNYFNHPLSSILPVELSSSDDRRNASQGLIIKRHAESKLEAGLFWDEPPIICGYNAASAKKSARVLVEMSPVISNGKEIKLGASIPLVVTRSEGAGTVTACLTDLAPHWSGGLVDWGQGRTELVTGREVGSDYPGFLKLLLEA